MTDDNRGPEDFYDELRIASKTIDYERAQLVIKDLITHIRQRDDEFPVGLAKTVLTLLRKNRWFDLMERVADALIACGQNHPNIRRQYAQSLLDQGLITASLCVLHRLVDDTDINGGQADDEEFKEAKGLLGRAYKQQYVASDAPHLSRNRRVVVEAIGNYRDVFEQDTKQLWHGINAVALTQRALRDRVELWAPREEAEDEVRMRARSIARQLDRLHDDQKAQHWDFATAVEAQVALSAISKTDDEKNLHLDKAVEWLKLYLEAPSADAFEYASTYRQLVEVWGLTPTQGAGKLLLPPLSAKQLQKEGGRLVDHPAMIEALRGTGENLERIYGKDGPVPLVWLYNGLEKARAVARIVKQDGTPHGTGFLVNGGDYADALQDEHLILTNHHVVQGTTQGPRPRAARAQFESVGGTEVEISEVLWASPEGKLDASLLRFSGELPKEVKPISELGIVPHPDEDDKERAYIIGHPQGRPAEMSMHDNVILDVDKELVHYRSPTERGSSGSPVFDTDWGLIALHRAGGSEMPMLNEKEGFYEANEGARIDAIMTAARKALDKKKRAKKS